VRGSQYVVKTEYYDREREENSSRCKGRVEDGVRRIESQGLNR
jgi:hypothetical protein